jgi:fluoride exporter
MTPRMPVIVGVAFGGALGASARYGLDRLIERSSSSVFPLSTFTLNVTGCFLIGVISAALVDRHHLPAWLRVGLVVGAVGGYTTFSTFAQEALDLGEIHHVATAAAYVCASVAAGLLAVYAGGKVGAVL